MVSPMGYLTLDNRYGLIDRDSIERAHVDEIYLETQRLLNQVPRSLNTPGPSNQADSVRGKLAEADATYAKMDYVAAMQPALEAFHMAQQMVEAQNRTQTQTQSTQTITTITSNGSMSSAQLAYTVAGIAIGAILGLLAANRRQKGKSTVPGSRSHKQM